MHYEHELLVFRVVKKKKKKKKRTVFFINFFNCFYLCIRYKMNKLKKKSRFTQIIHFVFTSVIKCLYLIFDDNIVLFTPYFKLHHPFF